LMIVLGELPALLGRLHTLAELCSVHQRFGSVILEIARVSVESGDPL